MPESPRFSNERFATLSPVDSSSVASRELGFGLMIENFWSHERALIPTSATFRKLGNILPFYGFQHSSNPSNAKHVKENPNKQGENEQTHANLTDFTPRGPTNWVRYTAYQEDQQRWNAECENFIEC